MVGEGGGSPQVTFPSSNCFIHSLFRVSYGRCAVIPVLVEDVGLGHTSKWILGFSRDSRHFTFILVSFRDN